MAPPALYCPLLAPPVPHVLLRYNDAVTQMRERIALREWPFVLASFRKADAGLSGLIERDRFRSLLKRLDFGVSNVDDKVRLVAEQRGLGGPYGKHDDELIWMAT